MFRGHSTAVVDSEVSTQSTIMCSPLDRTSSPFKLRQQTLISVDEVGTLSLARSQPWSAGLPRYSQFALLAGTVCSHTYAGPSRTRRHSNWAFVRDSGPAMVLTLLPCESTLCNFAAVLGLWTARQGDVTVLWPFPTMKDHLETSLDTFTPRWFSQGFGRSGMLSNIFAIG